MGPMSNERGGTMKHIQTLQKPCLMQSAKTGGCGEVPGLLQSVQDQLHGRESVLPEEIAAEALDADRAPGFALSAEEG